MTKRLTVAQAIVIFLTKQFVERDGRPELLLSDVLTSLPPAGVTEQVQ